ncbi:hypothetical protein [Microbacterium panaciterrae]|uniref:Lipoprotein n=1 Tax=Microbacterium panaciterrae TaxID=985759 RepID=A0ABP8P152_9MICO
MIRPFRTVRGALQLACLLVTTGCVVTHLAMLLAAPSVLAAAMTILAAACALCLRPRRTAPSDASWGGAMAMSATTILLHVWSGGTGGHGHSHAPVAVGSAPVDALHGTALGLNALELALLMAAVAAIGVRNRRRALPT